MHVENFGFFGATFLFFILKKSMNYTYTRARLAPATARAEEVAHRSHGVKIYKPRNLGLLDPTKYKTVLTSRVGELSETAAKSAAHIPVPFHETRVTVILLQCRARLAPATARAEEFA